MLILLRNTLATLLLLTYSAAVAQRFKTEDLEVVPISKHVFQHISYLKTQDFGKVSCNGMIIVNAGEAIVFDVPAEEAASAELLSWLKDSLHVRVKAVVATHFHADCLGGLKVFHSSKIPSYAQVQTLTFAAAKHFPVPQHSFKQKKLFNVGKQEVEVFYPGAGHTRDNVVAYYPAENIMFGGCLVKEQGAGKGNLEDADTKAWPLTVKNLKAKYPNARIVIPGHGKTGGADLLDYTISLF